MTQTTSIKSLEGSDKAYVDDTNVVEMRTKKLEAAEKLVDALKEFLKECKDDDGDPWSERPTQDIFKPYHPIQEAMRAWESAQ